MSWFSQYSSFAHERKSKAMLAVLITSLLCSCRSWLSSVVSAALKRPPHVPFCCSHSFSLRHSASFIFILFSASCSSLCLVWGVVPQPEGSGKSSSVACRVGERALETNRYWLGIKFKWTRWVEDELRGSKLQLDFWGLIWTIGSAVSQKHPWHADCTVWSCSLREVICFSCCYLVKDDSQASLFLSQSCLLLMGFHSLWDSSVVQMSHVPVGNNMIILVKMS